MFKLPLLTTYYARAKISISPISNDECFNFIPVHKKQLPCYPIFLYYIYPFTLSCVESLISLSQKKAIKGNREVWKEPVYKRGDTGNTETNCPNSPPAFSTHEEQYLCRQRWEWATWNLTRFNEQSPSSEQLRTEVGAVSPLKKNLQQAPIKCCYSSSSLVQFSHLLPYLT